MVQPRVSSGLWFKARTRSFGLPTPRRPFSTLCRRLVRTAERCQRSARCGHSLSAGKRTLGVRPSVWFPADGLRAFDILATSGSRRLARDAWSPPVSGFAKSSFPGGPQVVGNSSPHMRAWRPAEGAATLDAEVSSGHQCVDQRMQTGDTRVALATILRVLDPGGLSPEDSLRRLAQNLLHLPTDLTRVLTPLTMTAPHAPTD